MNRGNYDGDESTEGEKQWRQSNLGHALEKTPIDGRYEIKRFIGHGQYGFVFVAYDQRLKIELAIKILVQKNSSGRWELQKFLSPEEEEKFCLEARIMAELEDHPHIVKVKDFSIEPTPYIVMGLEGENLRKIYFEKQSVPLSFTLAINYVKQMASALDFMHNKSGVVHCDIKPENMLVKRYQSEPSAHQIALADFGIAQYIHRFRQMTLQEDRNIGTPQYMAPELFDIQNTPTFKSDQYALAVVAYELLSGVVPFTGSYQSLKIFHYNSDWHVPSLLEKVPGLPPAIEPVIMKALSKDPGERYYSIQQFADELEKASKPSTKRVTYTRRNFLKKVAIPTIIIIPVATIVGVVHWLWNHQSQPRPTYSGHNSSVIAVDWSADNYIASGDEEGKVHAYNAITLQPISPPFHDAQKHSILQLAWVPKKPFLLSSLNNNGDFRIYHALTNEPYYPPSQREQHYPAFQRDPNDPFVAFSWAEFTDLLLTSSKQTDVYDSPLDVGARLPDAPFKQHQDSIRASVWGWGPNNSIIITADDSSMIYLWNAETAKLLYSYQYNDPITSIALGPKPGLFAVAGQKEVCILQAGANSTVTKIDTYRHNGSVNDIAWSSDKKNPRLASCGDDKSVIIWQVNGHSKMVYPFNTVVNALSWSPDGRRLALANEDKTVVTMDVP